MNIISKNKQFYRLPMRLTLAASFALMCSITAHANETKLVPLDSNDLDIISAGGASITVHATADAMGDHTLTVTDSRARVHVKDRCGYRVAVVAGTGSAVALGEHSAAVAVVDANISANVTATRYVSSSLSRPGRSVSRSAAVILSR